jgi:hypothetical protein
VKPVLALAGAYACILSGSIGLAASSEGCAALQASNVPQATQALESCVAGQLISGVGDPAAIAVACSVQASEELADLVVFLASQLESAGKAPVGTANAVRAKVGR